MILRSYYNCLYFNLFKFVIEFVLGYRDMTHIYSLKITYNRLIKLLKRIYYWNNLTYLELNVVHINYNTVIL